MGHQDQVTTHYKPFNVPPGGKVARVLYPTLGGVLWGASGLVIAALGLYNITSPPTTIPQGITIIVVSVLTFGRIGFIITDYFQRGGYDTTSTIIIEAIVLLFVMSMACVLAVCTIFMGIVTKATLLAVTFVIGVGLVVFRIVSVMRASAEPTAVDGIANTRTIVDVMSESVVIITIAGLVVGIFFPGTITGAILPVATTLWFILYSWIVVIDQKD